MNRIVSLVVVALVCAAAPGRAVEELTPATKKERALSTQLQIRTEDFDKIREHHKAKALEGFDTFN